MSVPAGSGAKERRDEKFAAPCKHTTGARISTIQVVKDF